MKSTIDEFFSVGSPEIPALRGGVMAMTSEPSMYMMFPTEAPLPHSFAIGPFDLDPYGRWTFSNELI